MDVYSQYIPRPWQKRFDRQIGDRKRAFLLWARRHGKDVACWNYLIPKAIERKGSYFYLYPLQNQARKAIWEGMTSEGKRFLDYIPKELIDRPPNNTEMMIYLRNGSIIRILGSDNHDALRSSNPIGVVLSEYAWHHPLTWQSVIEPILQENKGWALFNTTPFGKNHAHDLWRYAQKNPDIWYTERVTNEDSGLLSEEELDGMRKRGVPEEVIQQEYFCSFDRGVDGSYYGKQMHELRQMGQIKLVRHDDYAKVYTAWDMGYGDSTAIWVYQRCGNEIHLIDYIECHGERMPFYIKILNKKAADNGWTFSAHYVPHDGNYTEYSSGQTRIQAAHDLGFTMTLLPRDKHIEDGIERVRKWLPKCYFDEKNCEKGILALESYRKKYDERNKVYANIPLHDHSSHGSDAFRYLCQAVELFQSGNSLELDEYRRLKQQYGFSGPEPQRNSYL